MDSFDWLEGEGGGGVHKQRGSAHYIHQLGSINTRAGQTLQAALRHFSFLLFLFSIFRFHFSLFPF